MHATSHTPQRLGRCALVQVREFHQVLEPRLLLTGVTTPLGAPLMMGQGFQSMTAGTPSLAADGAGGFLAVWNSTAAPQGVFAEFFDSASRAKAPAFQLITPAAGTAITESAVAMDSAGDFAVAYLAHEGSSDNLFLQRFTAAGVAAGSPLTVEAFDETGGQSLSDIGVGMDSSANVLVTWDITDTAAGQSTVYGQRFTPAGRGLWASTQSIVSGSIITPAVACDSSGSFAVVWANSGIWFEHFSAGGLSTGAALSLTAAASSDPAIAAGKAGYVATWAQGDQGIQGALLPNEGPMVISPLAATTSADNVSSLALTLNSSGQPMLAWLQGAPDQSELVLQRYNASLMRLGSRVLVTGEQAITPGAPGLAANASGRSVIVWTDSASTSADILAQVDDGTGMGKLTTLELVRAPAGSTVLSPAVAMNAAGAFICVWVQSDGATDSVLYQIFTPGGSASSSPITITTGAAGALSDPSIAYAPDGSFIFSWLAAVAPTDHRIMGFWTDAIGHADMPVKQMMAPDSGMDFSAAQVIVQSDGQPRWIWSQEDAAASTASILTRAFTTAGKVTGLPVMLALGARGAVNLPALAVAGDGTLLAAWHSGANIVGLSLDAAGTPVGAATTLWSLAGDDEAAGLALAPDAPAGSQTAAWRVAFESTNAGGATVMMDRLFGSDLTALTSVEMVASASTTDEPVANELSLAKADNGTTFALWGLDSGATTQVWLSVLDSKGKLAGPAHLVTTIDSSAGWQAAVAAGASGTCRVVWRAADASGAVSITAQAFDATGAPLGAAAVVASAAPTDAVQPAMPDVDLDVAGDAIFAWMDDISGGNVIHIRRMKADGTLDLDLQIASPDGAVVSQPSVAADDAGDFVILYQQTAGDGTVSLLFQRYDHTGATVGSPVTVAQSTGFLSEDAGMDGAGNVAVVWADDAVGLNDATAAFYDATNYRLGRPISLVAGSDDQYVSDVSLGMSADGSFVLGWQVMDSVANQMTTYARRFGTYVPGDVTPPHVVSVVVDNNPSLGLSSVQTDYRGIRTLTITFSKPVSFSPNDVRIQEADSVGGAGLQDLPWSSLTGSGTNTMTFTFSPAINQDTLLVTLNGDVNNLGSDIMDLAGNILDGEAKSGGAYLASGSLDLPSGDGAEGGSAVFYVTALDNVPPVVTSVMVDNNPSLGLSSIESRAGGISSITIHFSEPVFITNAGDIIVQSAASIGGPALGIISLLMFTGSGTDTVVISFVAVSDEVLKVTLESNPATGAAIVDTFGNLLDGDAPAGGSGKGYLASPADLPSGNGTAGGDAVFYVAAERPPHVTGVVVDGQPSLGLSSVESGKDGIRTVAVSFDEPVLFTAAQVAVDVVNVVGSAMSIRQITPASVTGSGSSTMLIAFAAGDVYQNTIEITLSGDPAGGVTDLAGNVLDGEAAGGGAYLADGSRDLPSGNGAPGGAASFYETAFTDLVAPRVTSVMIDNTPALNVSGVERSAQGISTITVLFSKPVTFDSSSVVIQPADSIGGAPLPGVSPLTPLRITGSGTNTMTITLAPGSVLQTVLRLTLDGDLADVNSIRDLSPTGNVLDGEPKVAADTYLANASTDLPSGDGTAGGSASFYVAAERPPHVTAVVVDGQPGLGLSSTEVGKDGLGTIAVSFDEPVVFSAGQVQVDVVNAVGSTTSLRQVTPTSVTGNGTDTMLISLAAGDVRQATIRVMLSGNISGGITDLAGNVLDGDGRAGDLYLAGPVDLPSGDGTPGGSASFYVTAFTDLVAPRVVSVVLDGNANWGLSATDHHLDGINTITIVFSKPVTFSDGAVVIQPVDSIGGAPLEGSTPVPPQSITGSGTNTMTITFAAGTAANGFWRVSLDGSVGESQAITDLSPTGNVLDGEPKVAADAYLAGAADLPSGDGTAGGSAVFYVAAAPMAGDFNGDGVVNGKDFLIWQEHYPQLGGAGQADGDANGDGNVNGADFLIWQGHYDPTPPTVTAVTVNNTPAEGVSSTDSSDGGIQTVTVTFSEPVTFTAQDVQVQVTDRVGGTTRTALAAPPAISGSGTDTMTLTFAPGSVVNKVLCITLAGTAASDGSAIADLAGNLLDGQAKGGGAYLASAADLPSGDGTAGGSAVFYVVSRTSSGLPGDFNGDGFVNGADFLIWQQNYGKIGGATLAMGDANGDGNVTGADFLVWQENYQPMK